MAALSKILRSLLHVPEYLVPKPILDLAWKFDGAHGWARERVFQQWCEQQEFRQCESAAWWTTNRGDWNVLPS
eukprot:s2538_g15.t2